MHAHFLVDRAPSELLQALCHRWGKEGSQLDGWLGAINSSVGGVSG